MSTIAAILGVDWNQSEWVSTWELRGHARKQAERKGFDVVDVLRAASEPEHTYPNGRYPSQRRHVRGGIVAVVDVSTRRIVTVYVDQVETEIRPDQVDTDALNFARQRRNRT